MHSINKSKLLLLQYFGKLTNATTTMIPTSLPNELFLIIQSFTTHGDYWRLMNTSSLLKLLKWETLQIQVNLPDEELTIDLISSRILPSIKDPLRQLSYIINMYVVEEESQFFKENLEIFLQSASIRLCDCSLLCSSSSSPSPSPSPPLSPSEIPLSLSPVNIFELLFSSSKRRLDLSFDSTLTRLPFQIPPSSSSTSSCEISQQIYQESNDKTLNNHHNLKRNSLKELTIYGFKQLSTVENLSSLHTLEIFSCPLITDVTCLSSLSVLQLHSCNSITSLEGLGNISDLSLVNLVGVRDISPLRNNSRLMITECVNITTGYSSLKNVKNLYTDILSSMLKYVENVESCQIRNFQSTSIPAITDPPPTNPEMVISNSIPVENFSFSRLKRGYFYSCSMAIFSLMKRSFDHLLSVTLESCKITSLPNGIGTIPIIKCILCLNLNDISCLGGEGADQGKRNKSVEINGCPAVRDFSSLATIPKVNVSNCYLFKSFDQVKNHLFDLITIQELSIRNCRLYPTVSGGSDFYSLFPSHFESFSMTKLELINCGSKVSTKGLENILILIFGKCNVVIDSSLKDGKNQKLVLEEAAEVILEYPEYLSRYSVNNRWNCYGEIVETVYLKENSMNDSK